MLWSLGKNWRVGGAEFGGAGLVWGPWRAVGLRDDPGARGPAAAAGGVPGAASFTDWPDWPAVAFCAEVAGLAAVPGFAPPAEDFAKLSVRMPPRRTAWPPATALVKTSWVLKSAKTALPTLRESRSAVSLTESRKDWAPLFTFAVTTPVAALMLVIRQGVLPAFPFNTCGASPEARLPMERASKRNTKPRGPQ